MGNSPPHGLLNPTGVFRWAIRKAKTSCKAKKTVKTKAKKNGVDGYKEHRPGSRNGKAHELFDKLGREQALSKVTALGIKENTAKSWFRSFTSK